MFYYFIIIVYRLNYNSICNAIAELSFIDKTLSKSRQLNLQTVADSF